MATTGVAVDIQALQVEGFSGRGIGRYVAGYSAAMARRGALSAALLAPELPPPDHLPPQLVAGGLARWDTVTACRELLEQGTAAYHVTAPFLHCAPGEPAALAMVEHWARAGLPRVVTLYDLIPLRAPRHYLPTAAHEDRYRSRAEWVAASDLVLAISEHTRREAMELLGCRAEKVVAVGAGVSRFFSPPDGTDDELWRFHFPALAGRPFVLTVGGNDARKGTDRAVAALGSVVAGGLDVAMVVAGEVTGEWLRQLLEVAGASGVAERVVFAGAVSDELLRACYRRAALTLMPSLAEGAGLPILESAACGTPALASDRGALAETAATTEAVFDPTDTATIAEAVAAALADDQRRARVLAAQQERARSATWDAVAARAATAIGDLCSGPQSPTGRVPVRRRVALVGPLPPGGGGIGAYDGRLLDAAAALERVEIDAVVTSRPRPQGCGFGVVAPDAFGTDVRPASYDHVVYVLGNSAGHLATVELALRHPGWIWLHEVRLAALATTALEAVGDADFQSAMTWLMHRAYPGRPPIEAARRAGRDHLALGAAGVGLVAPLAERCRGVLVNSETARRLLLLDLPPLASHPPVKVLPPACPPVRRRPVRAPGEPVVVAFGITSMAKRPDLLVDAAAASGCRVAFVGPCPPFLAQFIAERAALRGVAGRVEVVGEVGPDGWQEWIDRAALAVQLRDSASGETSAAILEALAAGVPVLTNLASAAEYPAGTIAWIGGGDLDAGELGRRMADLVASPAELDTLSTAGLAFAAGHQFGHLAEALLDALGC